MTEGPSRRRFAPTSPYRGEVNGAMETRMPTEKFQFTGEGGHQLAAALDLPDGEPAAYALFAHCFTCGKDVLAAKRIATALSAKGIAMLRFDFTGLGSSEGEFANATFSSNVADLVRAADHLRNVRKAPAILIGHSLGGAAVLAAAAQHAGSKGRGDHRGALRSRACHRPVRGPCRSRSASRARPRCRWPGRPFPIRREFLDDVAEQRLLDAGRTTCTRRCW